MYHNVIGLVVLSCVPIVVDSDELVGKKRERKREREGKKKREEVGEEGYKCVERPVGQERGRTPRSLC